MIASVHYVFFIAVAKTKQSDRSGISWLEVGWLVAIWSRIVVFS